MTSSKTLTERRNTNSLFRRLALLTVAIVYLLIMVGGVVRSTGAGMGCPDWPTCFGSWVPPTEESQLPLNYKELYGAKLKGEVEFNAVKTWTEYVNRLLGVFTGFMIFGTLLASISFLRTDKVVFYLSLVAFLLVGFQGWLGAKVVSSELLPAMITLHMLLAIILVFVLLYVLARSYAGTLQIEALKNKARVNQLLLVVLLLSVAQVLIGTQVREAMDVVIDSLGYSARNEWIGSLGITYYIHRSFSLLVLVTNGLLVYWIQKDSLGRGPLALLSRFTLLIIGLEIVTGIAMAYWGVPAFAQPLHLTFAIAMLGAQFVLYLFINAEKVFRISQEAELKVVQID
ncbi:COX15/CtaA family protein [Telluribacter sp.]|jgi:cytochrome c oxidase assembly protein subunit 15|uniref:COX15/CtaA family protein n=1 Tax=Telluribacter sp. TaxID=1978767 RepID=UPI002E107084|nr:COX15/CtaA family protein [Telluribacter sp.]